MRSWIVPILLGLIVAGCIRPVPILQEATNTTSSPSPSTPTSIPTPPPRAPAEPAPNATGNETVTNASANATSATPPPAATNATNATAPTNETPATNASNATSGPWPHAGSFVTYDVRGFADSSCCTAPYEANITFRYDGATWVGMCDLDSHKFTSTSYAGGSSYHWANASASKGYRHAPPMGPTNTTVGANPALTIFHGCTPTSTSAGSWWFFTPAWTVVSNGTHDGHHAWLARGTSFWYGTQGMAWWDMDTGLVLGWTDSAGSGGGANGNLTATDAPLSTA